MNVAIVERSSVTSFPAKRLLKSKLEDISRKVLDHRTEYIIRNQSNFSLSRKTSFKAAAALIMRVLLLLVILAIARVRAAQGDLDQQLRLADHQSRIFASMIPTAFSKRNNSKCLDDSLIYVESVFHSTNWARKSK